MFDEYLNYSERQFYSWIYDSLLHLKRMYITLKIRGYWQWRALTYIISWKIPGPCLDTPAKSCLWVQWPIFKLRILYERAGPTYINSQNQPTTSTHKKLFCLDVLAINPILYGASLIFAILRNAWKKGCLRDKQFHGFLNNEYRHYRSLIRPFSLLVDEYNYYFFFFFVSSLEVILKYCIYF